MVGWDEPNNNLNWWWEQLNLSEDWNSLSTEARKDLTKKLQQAIMALGNLNITKEEVLALINLTDAPTVWDALLSLATLPDKDNRNRWQLMAYLRATVVSIWKSQHQTKLTWQPKVPVEDKTEAASWEDVERIDPRRLLKRRKTICSVCGSELRKDNGTGKCSRCQQNGRKSEH